MQLTKVMQEAMILSLLRNDETPQGVECSFFQFGTVGVKFYGYGEEAEAAAENAFSQQSNCYQHGLAPRPGELFSIALKNAGKDQEQMILYGYTTEVAIVCPIVPDAERRTMLQALDEAGLPSGDMHNKNIGYIVDEETDTFKLVPIDFGYNF